MKNSEGLGYFEVELKEFQHELNMYGLINALRYLNKRTPHRYTGLYKFNGDILTNIAKYDKYTDGMLHDDDVPVSTTYCSIVRTDQSLEITDSSTDRQVKNKIDTPVISYFGVLINDAKGIPFGTLCHYDLKRCEERINDFPLLKAAAQQFYEHLQLKYSMK